MFVIKIYVENDKNLFIKDHKTNERNQVIQLKYVKNSLNPDNEIIQSYYNLQSKLI